ncbi:tumor necrosis factor receptor superfamily member 1A isoform X2 [Puntigrus tetrazona]|uniref:tumor necrosis factor receptor superfamily member 1A isoform X2 n=1 Tax=Puntigrus tetrazona TaxID=1606681 RepID=UPI001C89E9EB|nr:tumor necrosis factor receptor superfamily member 1A isoform X2 [Puntigrus tetrazona]
MIASTLCLDLVFILCIASQCQSEIPPMTDGSCSPGYYRVKEDLCEMCGSGFYTDLPNNLTSCLRCTLCDGSANEEENVNCTATQDRVCICKSGFYQNNNHCKPCKSCQNCAACFKCKKNCNQKTAKTTAVVCETGYFPEGGQCISCVKYKCKNESCKSFCSSITQEPYPLLLVVLVTVTFLGGLLSFLLIWFCRRRWLCCQARIWHVGKHPPIQIPPDDPNNVISIPTPMERNGATYKGLPVSSYAPGVLSGDLQSIMGPLIANGNPKLMQALQKESWPAPVLYTVIRAIPVTRWKEFLRLLSMSDDQMERIELETGPSYLEKQYHMLRLWSQSSGATMENIYSALHYMNLSGCAQELQEKLEQLQASA